MTPAAAILSRVAAALLGNYVATSAAGALLAVALAALGLARADAVVIASIAAILLYLVVLIWAIHAPRLGRLWLLLIAIAAASVPLARLLGPSAP